MTIKDSWTSSISLIDLKNLKRNDFMLNSNASNEISQVDPIDLSNDIICYRVTENLIEEDRIFIWEYPINEKTKKVMTMGHHSIFYFDILLDNKWLL